MNGAATFSECGRYRYWLQRTVAAAPGKAVFVMLNPSTADEAQDDPTIRRCIDFARRWGYGSMEVVNLFAWRSPDPQELRVQSVYEDVIGSENDEYLTAKAAVADVVVCAWGVDGEFMRRGREVAWMLAGAGVQLMCLGRTKSGQPKHPLYLRHDTELAEYDSWL